MIFPGDYDWQIPLLRGKAFIHKTINRIISIIICTGNLFNGIVLQISHFISFITIIFIFIFGACYAPVVVFRFYQTVIQLSCLRDLYGRLTWSRILGTHWRWSKIRYLLLHAYRRFMILYCIYFGQSGETVLITNLQFKTKSERKQRENIYKGHIIIDSLKDILNLESRIGLPNTTSSLLVWNTNKEYGFSNTPRDRQYDITCKELRNKIISNLRSCVE